MQRRRACLALARSCRWASSYANLVAAQKALRAGKKVPGTVAKDFTNFFNVSVPKGKGAETVARAYFDMVVKKTVAEEEGSAVRVQVQERREREDLPILLAGCNYKRQTLTLYSVATDRIVVEHAAGADAWEQADTLLQVTGGNRQFIVIAVVQSAIERRLLLPAMNDFVRTVRESGLQPVSHVDSLELAEALDRDPPSLASMTGGAASKQAPTPLSEEWFRAHWILLRTLACRAADADPVHTVNSHIFPQLDVYVVHLVRAGSRSMNISIWDPARRRRYAAKGMLSDILSCLFSTQSQHFILIPTNRTDRAILFRCRVALTKAGHCCVLVFASEMDEQYRRVFQSDPGQYWRLLKSASGGLDADLLAQVYCTAGNTSRTYHRKMLLEGKHKGLMALTRERNAAKGIVEDDDIATMTEVGRWLAFFDSPQRRAAEQAEEKHYNTFLTVAFTANEHLAYGQPRCPLAPQNFIISASFADSSGSVLEPWGKFTGRDQFELPCMDDYQVLVVHDAKQFLLLLGWNSPELKKFLRRGGRVWCTMLAEYLLDAQRTRTGSNSLCEVALRYGHLLPPATLLGMQAEELPLAFHRRHLIPAAPAVATVFRDQLRRALAQYQLVSIAHRMDSLLAMTSMEWSGVHIDTHEAERQSRALANAAAVLDRTLAAFVPPEVPLDMREFFDWQSVTQMHAYFFGGHITVGRSAQARTSRQWTSNLVHLCHRYGSLPQMVGELHLQRFASESGISTGSGGGGRRLPARVASHIDERGSQKKKKYRLVLFDVETTGLNPTTDELIEIALFDPVENTSFASLVRPQRRISPRTISIHHITDEIVRDAPTAGQVVKGVVEYLRLDEGQRDPDEVLILLGHNVFSLDEPMLRRALVIHAPEADHDSILFCDSVVLLRALKAALQDSRMQRKKVDPTLLEALTSSLRLSKLIENLRVTPEGELHRADTDTKALWCVLVNAFGLSGQPPAKQRDGLLTEAARTLVLYPATGSFVPLARKTNALTVQLPGVARGLLVNKGKLVSSLASKPFSEKTLMTLYTHGAKVAGLLLQRMGLERHNSRFLQASNNRSVSVLHDDKAVHQHIDMTATTTSRTSSAYPSLQNIPKDDKSSVRRLFVSRFGSKGRCVEIDYAQLEIVVLAILCRDANLMRDLNNGVDFHIKRAEFFSGLPYKEIYEGYRRGIPKYVKLRKTAKQFSFQRLYGAGVPLLHKTTGIPVQDLEASIRKEGREYPGIAQFHSIARSVALRPNNPGLPTNFILEMPTGLRMSFNTRDVVLNLPPLKNYPIQGYGAELAQIMLGRVFRHFTECDFYKQKAFIVNFVHDSVWLDCHVDVLEACVRDTAGILSSVHTYIPKRFPGVDVCVPLKVSSSCGVDMCSMQSVDDGFRGILKQKRCRMFFAPADLLPTPAEAAAASALAQERAVNEGAGGAGPQLGISPCITAENDDDVGDETDADREEDDQSSHEYSREANKDGMEEEGDGEDASHDLPAVEDIVVV